MPDPLPLEEALAWARSRAARVRVHRGGFGGPDYTAGDILGRR
jgi:hypothetical protein